MYAKILRCEYQAWRRGSWRPLINKARVAGQSFRSAISFAPMPNPPNSNDSDCVGYFVNDAIIANANSPIVLRAREFPATGRTRISGEGLERFNDAVVNGV